MTLQTESLSAAEAQSIAADTIDTLKDMILALPKILKDPNEHLSVFRLLIRVLLI